MTYRILDHFWHAAHGARLLQIPAEWTYFSLGDRAPWDWSQRDLPPALRRVVYHYEPGRYDVALLHLDQWCADSYSSLRAFPYRFLNELIQDIPKIVVMHGLPEGESNRQAVWRLLGDNWLVTNTPMSLAMWSPPRGRAILPGYDVEEWGPCTYERPEIVATVAGSNTPKDHHGVSLIQRLKRDLPITWIGKDVRFDSYADYRAYLAGASIYLNPTQHSQHPGARNEAMLTGLATVSTAFFDEAEYIRDGETGFLANDYLEIRERLEQLLGDPALCRRMGGAGREAARVMFHKDRYAADWLALLGEVTGK